MHNENYYINRCRALIEQKLDWRDSRDWQSQDFERLSALLLEQTRISLSVSTLKRIWGKIRYENSPNLATLNALAQFAGHADWSTFTSNGLKPEPNSPIPEDFTGQAAKPFRKAWLWGLGVLVAGAGIFALLADWNSGQPGKPSLTFGDIRFRSQPVTLGLPNSVVFDYDAADSNADSVFIQQSWDERLRHRVDKFAHEYVCTYYRPGYFRAKLILNDSIVREHDLFIETDGWLGTVDREPMPVYFPKTIVEKGEAVSLNEADLSAQGIDFSKNVEWTSLFQVNKSMSLPSDNFCLTAELKNTWGKGDGVCQLVKIVLLAEDGAIVIPLGIKGCSGEFGLVVANERIDGKTKDLSGFGVDFSDFVLVRCEASNERIQIFVNRKLAYEGEVKNRIGRFVGTCIRFLGTGAVRKFELQGN